MTSFKSHDIHFDSESNVDIDEEKRKKRVIISNIPPGTKKSDLQIYVQKESNGGGEVDDVKMFEEGKAVVIFDEEEVAQRILTWPKHKFEGVWLHVEPYGDMADNKDDIQVFSVVSAKLDPSLFTVNVKKLDDLLRAARNRTGANYLRVLDGYRVSGTLKQINELSLFLSQFAKSPIAQHKSDEKRNGQQNDHLHNKEDSDLEPLELDVEPKLMQLLQNEVRAIENKYKMKIDWNNKANKAKLNTRGTNAKIFHEGKAAFITLYQKEFQDLKEKDFPLGGVNNIADVDNMIISFMERFSVVIERNLDKNIHIFGKEDHVSQVMQQLQTKFGKKGKGRQALRGTGNADARAAMPPPLTHTLSNGVVVSVHQGDITKLQVDVIVNAANEHLDHDGGVAGAIVKQGGRQIQHESDNIIRQHGFVPVGQVAWTGPGYLPCKRIFHAVGPQWKVHGEERSRKCIFDACMQSFDMASKLGFCSIGLPGISSGMYGVPKQVCAEMMFTAAEAFIFDVSKDNQLQDIRFVNIDVPTYEAFRKEFQNRYNVRNGPDKNSRSNPQHADMVDHSREAQKETENQRSNFVQTGRDWGKHDAKPQTPDKVNVIDTPERQKREKAALRRMEQEKNNKEGRNASSEEFVKEESTNNKNRENQCCLCYKTLDSDQTLEICESGHTVCKTCFDGIQTLENKGVCPTCHRDIPRFVQQPPNGKMKSGVMERNLLGYEGCATLYIDYGFPGGIQGPLHPNPGSPYDKLYRRTFLPDNQEGREVLKLFKKAFDAGILFTIGKSPNNQKDNQIIFNPDIEHKYNVNGGASLGGYPDQEYLERVKTQLNAKGIA